MMLSVLLLLVSAITTQDVGSLSRRIAKEKDRVDPEVFAELASIGDAESLEALEKGVGSLKKIESLRPAYEAFALYAGQGELADLARQFLARNSFRAKNKEARPVIVRTLCAFGKGSLPILERVLADHPDPRCRTLACDPLVALLAERGDVESVELVLDNASVGWDEAPPAIGVGTSEAAAFSGKTEREVLLETLGECKTPEVEALFVARLDSRSASREWKLLLIKLLAEREGEAITRALAEAFDDSDPAVVLAALEEVVRRDDAAGLGPKLEPVFASRVPALRRAAVVALGRLELTEAEWRERILSLSRSKDDALRMGAVVALANVRTVPARERLHELLADPEWPVRAEAVEQVARLRRKESVPVLIARLGKEAGRMREDVYAALRVVTGLDLGRSPVRWERWWAGEGEHFVVPSVREIEQAERERAERETARGGTAASTIYGVQVFSERVCFVLDVSGSMRTNAGKGVDPSGPQDPNKPTRMDVAKDELMDIVRAFPDGKLFNLIFFESEVRRLSGKLVKMKKANRQKALRFIRDQYALGATALYPALQLAFKDPLVDTIYLISDGAPTVGEVTDIAAVREEVRRWNAARHVKIHGVTIGQDSTLLQWLTADTGGTYVRRD